MQSAKTMIQIRSSASGCPEIDCIQISDFFQLSLELQREYAIDFGLPKAGQLSKDEIRALLSGNQWIPALTHHVWIPRVDRKGILVSKDVNDLKQWYEAAKLRHHNEPPSTPSPSHIYQYLLDQWEMAQQQRRREESSCDTSYAGDVEMMDAPVQGGTSQPSTDVAGARPSQVKELTAAQNHLAEARRKLTSSKTYRRLGRRSIHLENTTSTATITREETSQSGQTRPPPTIICNPNHTKLENQVSNATRLVPEASESSLVTVANNESSQSKETSQAVLPAPPKRLGVITKKFKAPQQQQQQPDLTAEINASIDRIMGATSTPQKKIRKGKRKATSNRKMTSESASAAETNSTGIRPSTRSRVIKDLRKDNQVAATTGPALNLKDAHARLVEQTRPRPSSAFDDVFSDNSPSASSNKTRPKGNISFAVPAESRPRPAASAAQAQLQAVAQKAGTFRLREVEQVPQQLEASRDLPTPPHSPAMVYLACVLRGKPVERQHDMLEVLKGENSGTLSTFFTGFKLMFSGVVTQAIAAGAHTVISGIQSLFSSTKSPLKRPRADEEDGQAAAAPAPAAMTEDMPVTPQRKRARYENSVAPAPEPSGTNAPTGRLALTAAPSVLAPRNMNVSLIRQNQPHQMLSTGSSTAASSTMHVVHVQKRKKADRLAAMYTADEIEHYRAAKALLLEAESSTSTAMQQASASNTAAATPTATQQASASTTAATSTATQQPSAPTTAAPPPSPRRSPRNHKSSKRL